MVDMMMGGKGGGGGGDPSTYFGLAFSAFCNSFSIGSPYKASWALCWSVFSFTNIYSTYSTNRQQKNQWQSTYHTNKQSRK